MLGSRYTLNGVLTPEGNGGPEERLRITFCRRFRPVIPADGLYRADALFSDGTRLQGMTLRIEQGILLPDCSGAADRSGQHVRIEIDENGQAQ